MKKIFTFALAAVGLFAASCQKEQLGNRPKGDETTAVFSISLPEALATKANLSDGTKATKLYWAVYDHSEEKGRGLIKKLEGEPIEMKELKTTVNITLVKNYAYDIVFWAQSEVLAENGTSSYYSFDWDKAQMTVDYNGDANDENRDAFYQVVTEYRVASTPTEVKLYRPFAQINFGASDYEDVEKLIGNNMKSTVEFSGLPNVLNLLDRTATCYVEDVNGDLVEDLNGIDVEALKPTHVPAAAPETNPDYYLPVKDQTDKYAWVAMNYVLAPYVDKPDEKAPQPALTNVVGRFFYNGEEVTIPVPNVPYQRNFRTNIIGDLFSENAQFIVEIVPIYDEPSEDIIYPAETVVYDSSKGSLADYLSVIGASTETNVSLELGGAEVVWETGAEHGSTPLIGEDNKFLESLTIQNGTFKATGAGVGPVRLANGGTLIFKNTKIVDESESYAESNWEYGYLEMAGNLEFHNCEFVNAVQIEGEHAYYEGCTFNSNKESEYDVWVANGSATFVNCTFKGYRGLKTHEAYGTEVSEIVVDGCTFDNLTKKPSVVIGTVNADTKITIKNSDIISCQPGDQGLYIYESDTDVATFVFTEEGNYVYDIPADAEGVKVGTLDNTVELTGVAALEWFEEQVNGGDDFEGKTVKLMTDVDLKKEPWTPIGQIGNWFAGTFDGQGNTIFNLVVDSTTETNANYASGFFGSSVGTICNLTIDGAKVTGNHFVAALAGYAYGTIENCHVVNSEVSCIYKDDDASGDKCGTIAGLLAADGNNTIKSCTAAYCVVDANRDAGQIVGAAKSTNVTDCTATGVVVNWNRSGEDDENANTNIISEVVGREL